MMKPNCVVESIACAWTYRLAGYDVHIAVQHIRSGVDHAQAEAEINGEWVGLTMDPQKDIHPYGKEFPDAEGYRIVGLFDFIGEQKKVLRNTVLKGM
jgi:hypothetical protein